MSLDPRLLGERVEQYGVDLLDAYGNFIVELPLDMGDGTGVSAGVTGGSVDFNLDAQIMGTGSLTILNPGDLIDWLQNRFRPWVSVNGIRWNLGVYVPASPDFKYLASGGVQVDVTVGDRTTLMSTLITGATASYPAGTVVTDLVNALVFTCTGDTQTNIVPSSKTLSSPLTENPYVSYQQVANDLLHAIGYNPIWCDGDGVFSSEPWVDPSTQAPDVVFAEGSSAIHSADFEVTQDTNAVPNRVICRTTGDATNPGMESIATNEDDSSPYSYNNRGGQWITTYYDGVTAADQASLDAIAAKNLKLNSTPPWYVSVSHATVPLVGRQVVQFTSAGIDRQVTVNEWSVSLTPGSLMTGKWLAVNS